MPFRALFAHAPDALLVALCSSGAALSRAAASSPVPGEKRQLLRLHHRAVADLPTDLLAADRRLTQAHACHAPGLVRA
jgi:hypothetical protein